MKKLLIVALVIALLVMFSFPASALASTSSWWAGEWDTFSPGLGTLTLIQTGLDVTGSYAYYDKHQQVTFSGTVLGEVIGNTLTGKWEGTGEGEPPIYSGDFKFTMEDGCGGFSGTYNNGVFWVGIRNWSPSLNISMDLSLGTTMVVGQINKITAYWKDDLGVDSYNWYINGNPISSPQFPDTPKVGYASYEFQPQDAGTYEIAFKLWDSRYACFPKGEVSRTINVSAAPVVTAPTPAPEPAEEIEVESIVEEVEVLGVESVRTKPLTVWQVGCNDDGHLELIFVYPYKDNNWLTIYDIAGNEVHREDISYSDPKTIVALPDGMYTVKTFHSEGHIIQEFTVGLPCGVAVEGVAELPKTGFDYTTNAVAAAIIAGLIGVLVAFRKKVFKTANK